MSPTCGAKILGGLISLGRADLLEAICSGLLFLQQSLLFLSLQRSSLPLFLVPSHRLRRHYRHRLHRQRHQSPSPSPAQSATPAQLAFSPSLTEIILFLFLAFSPLPTEIILAIVPSHRLRHHYHLRHRLHSQCHVESHVIHEVLVLLKRMGLAAWADIEISQTNLDAWPEEGDILIMDLDIHVTEVDDNGNELEEEEVEEEEEEKQQQGGGGEGGLTNSRETIDPTLTAYNTSCGEMRSEARDAFFVEGKSTSTAQHQHILLWQL